MHRWNARFLRGFTMLFRYAILQLEQHCKCQLRRNLLKKEQKEGKKEKERTIDRLSETGGSRQRR
jgi:hypothetical protein